MAKQTLSAFLRELQKVEPALARAFEAVVQDIRSTAQRSAIEAAIERRDVQGVINALNLSPEFWAPLDAQIEQAFRQGAIWQASQAPKKAGPAGPSLAIRFNQRNPRAENWARRRAGELITEIVDDTRTAVSRAVEIGLSEGRGADDIATALIGRRRGQKRVGGLVGLHSRDVEAVLKAQGELGDPSRMALYLRRERRDRRFDGTVRKAQREGRALNKREIERVTGRYADRLLVTRGQRIARTEAHAAVSAGRHEAVWQMVESGQVPASAVTVTWQATPGPRTRDSHWAMNGQTVAFGEAFTSQTSGAQMMHPGDTSLGAPAEETINCRCGHSVEIDFTQLAR